MNFFIVEILIYSLGRDEEFRLFRPNIPAVQSTKRWYHCKVPHANPESVARARPDRIYVGGGFQISAYKGKWAYDGDLTVWIFEPDPWREADVVELPFPTDRWTAGRYTGEPLTGHR